MEFVAHGLLQSGDFERDGSGIEVEASIVAMVRDATIISREGAPGSMTDYRRLFDLSGKTAVVLGAASGIGKASAEALAALGADVMCADVAPDGAQATAATIRAQGGLAEAAICDAAGASDITALATSAALKFQRLDIAVTTSGSNLRKAILDCTEDDLDRVINLNVKGTVRFFQAFGRIMVKQNSGSIIACPSARAVTVEPAGAVDGSTRAAIGLLVKGFAAEVGRFGVRVNAIAPVVTERRDDRHAGHAVFNRWSQPDEIATAVAYLASDAAGYVSGSTLFADGGWSGTDGPPAGLTQLAG